MTAQFIDSSTMVRLIQPIDPEDLIRARMEDRMANMGVDANVVNKAIVTINSRLRALPKDKVEVFSCVRQGWPHTIVPVLEEWFSRHWQCWGQSDRSGDVCLYIQWQDRFLGKEPPMKAPQGPKPETGYANPQDP